MVAYVLIFKYTPPTFCCQPLASSPAGSSDPLCYLLPSRWSARAVKEFHLNLGRFNITITTQEKTQSLSSGNLPQAKSQNVSFLPEGVSSRFLHHLLPCQGTPTLCQRFNHLIMSPPCSVPPHSISFRSIPHPVICASSPPLSGERVACSSNTKPPTPPHNAKNAQHGQNPRPRAIRRRDRVRREGTPGRHRGVIPRAGVSFGGPAGGRRHRRHTGRDEIGADDGEGAHLFHRLGQHLERDRNWRRTCCPTP